MLTRLGRLLAQGPVVAHGTTAAYAAWLVAQLGQRAPGQLWVVTADDDALRAFAEDLRFFAPELALAELPGIEVSPYTDVFPDQSEVVARVGTLWRVAAADRPISVIVTSAGALSRRTIAPAELLPRGQVVRRGQHLDRDALVAGLVEAGWQRAPVVDEPGTFAVRGGVLDVFSPVLSHPVRLELFGDEVETLRTFDVESQRTLREIQEIALTPVREVIATGTQTPRLRLREHAEVLIHPSKATRRLIEQLEANPHFVGVHGLTPAFHDHMCSPLDYAPATATVVVIDPDAVQGAARQAWADAEARHAARREQGDFVYPPKDHFVPPQELAEKLRAYPRRLELPRLELVRRPGDADDGSTSLRVTIDELTALRGEMTRLRQTRDHDEQQGRALARASVSQPMVTARPSSRQAASCCASARPCCSS